MKLATKVKVAPDVMASIMNHLAYWRIRIDEHKKGTLDAFLDAELSDANLAKAGKEAFKDDEGYQALSTLGKMLMHSVSHKIPEDAREMELTLTANIT